MATVGDVMTRNPAFCTPDSSVPEAARIMRDHDCGVVPVVEDAATRRLVGVVTDRDIVVRVVADGGDPAGRSVRDCWTERVRTLTPEATLEECRQMMEAGKVRRVPIVDANGSLVGIVAMADLAEEMPAAQLGRALEEVSELDARQLYSEVNEESRTRNTVTPVSDPVEQRTIVPPS